MASQGIYDIYDSIIDIYGSKISFYRNIVRQNVSCE